VQQACGLITQQRESDFCIGSPKRQELIERLSI
jgi:hypothetical protein